MLAAQTSAHMKQVALGERAEGAKELRIPLEAFIIALILIEGIARSILESLDLTNE